MNNESLVSVVIPTYNRKDKLKSLINSVLNSDYHNIEIIVVDDASTDGTYEEVKVGFPSIQVLRNEEEKLLAGSRNVGILKTNGEFIFLIDDDNVIAKDTVSELAHVMKKDTTIGVAGPLMYYLRDPSRIWCGRVKRNYVTSRTYFPERDKLNVNSNRILESDDFPNALMIRRNIIYEVGFFDEVNFKIHYDEADFCNRVRQAGFRIVLCPTAKVWHDTFLPHERISKTRKFRVHTYERAFYVARNRILFFRKYSRLYEFAIFLVIFMPLITLFYLIMIITDTRLLFRQRLACMYGYIKGILRGLKL